MVTPWSLALDRARIGTHFRLAGDLATQRVEVLHAGRRAKGRGLLAILRAGYAAAVGASAAAGLQADGDVGLAGWVAKFGMLAGKANGRSDT